MTHAHQAYLIHALSPLHVGVGQDAGAVDLPIARYKGTNIPYIPGSSIKGVLRDAFTDDPDQRLIFGPEREQASDHAGALIAADARLLALPVRSLRGAFAYVTSPLLLRLAKRDLTLAGLLNTPEIPTLSIRAARYAKGSNVLIDGNIYLEDLRLSASQDAHAEEWAKYLAERLGFGEPQELINRFIVVDDDTMSFLYDSATQIDTRIRLDPDTRTVASGALWTEESLPAESILISLFSTTPSRNYAKTPHDKRLSAEDIRDKITSKLKGTPLQFGGKATVGRGLCQLHPL
jgi:CRISPR-associated protein Cmr4